MKPKAEITISDVVYQFWEYYRKPGNGAWGNLHIVLADNNVKDVHVEFCIKDAQQRGDTEGADLGRILLKMSKGQRLRLSAAVDAYGRTYGTPSDYPTWVRNR